MKTFLIVLTASLTLLVALTLSIRLYPKTARLSKMWEQAN
jgi:hypothetical protein